MKRKNVRMLLLIPVWILVSSAGISQGVALHFTVKINTYTPPDESVCVYFQNLEGSDQCVFKMRKENDSLYTADIHTDLLGVGTDLSYKYCRNFMPAGADESFDDRNKTGMRTIHIGTSTVTIQDEINKWRWIPPGRDTLTIDTTAYLSTPPANLYDSSFQCGIWLPDFWWNRYWAPGDFYDHTLDHIIMNSGANWMQISPACAITQFYPVPQIDDQNINSTPDSILIKIITDAHKKGLKVYLSPFVYPYMASDTCTTYHSATWWGDFKNAWEPILLRYAQIAQDYGVEMFQFVMWTNNGFWSIREEEKYALDSIGGILLGDLKDQYTGKIVIQYNKYGPQLDLYKAGDYLGIILANFFPWKLGTDKTPTVAEMRTRLSDGLDNDLYPLISALGKKVIVNSISACSYDGTTIDTPDWAGLLYYFEDDTTVPIDVQEQADDYEAMLHEVTTRDWIAGAYSFNYNYWSSIDKAPSIRSKPAEGIVRKWFSWIAPDNRFIRIDTTTHGTTVPEPSAYITTRDSEITLTAVPDSGYLFETWTGNIDSSLMQDNPLTLTMDRNIMLKPVFTAISTGIPVTDEQSAGCRLSQNIPNPFDTETTIQYRISRKGHYQLKVYNLLGEEIATLVDSEKDRGEYSVTFTPHGLTPGIYLYKLSADHVHLIKKMLIR